MVVHLRSPNERYDMTYLRNYALLNVRDRLARIDGVGQVHLFGSGDYSMRVWLDPQKVPTPPHGERGHDVAKRVDDEQEAAGAAERHRALVAQPGAGALALRGQARLPRRRGAARCRVDQQLVAGHCVGDGEQVAGAKTVVVIVVVSGCRQVQAAERAESGGQAEQLERIASASAGALRRRRTLGWPSAGVLHRWTHDGHAAVLVKDGDASGRAQTDRGAHTRRQRPLAPVLPA